MVILIIYQYCSSQVQWTNLLRSTAVYQEQNSMLFTYTESLLFLETRSLFLLKTKHINSISSC